MDKSWQGLKPWLKVNVLQPEMVLEVVVRSLQDEHFRYKHAEALFSRFQGQAHLPGAHDPEVSAGSADYTAAIDADAIWELSHVNTSC